MTIIQNKVNIQWLSHGIVVETPPGAPVSSSAYSVTYNKIVMEDGGPNVDNKGIWVTGGTGDNYDISFDTVIIKHPGSKYYNAKGIVFEQCTGMGHTVSSNYVQGVGSIWSSGKVGIQIKAVQNGVYCLNQVNGTRDGMNFYGYNFPADIEGNRFNYHLYGLVLDGTAFSPAVTGPQFRKLNWWDPLGYKLLAAVNTGDPLKSRFFIHSPNVLYFPPAPFVNPASGWFFGDFGAPSSLTCFRREQVPNEVETGVADGSYFAATATPLEKWEMRRNLYYKLLRNPDYGQGNPVFVDFLATEANTTAGLFARIEYDLYQAGKMPSTLKSSLDALNGTRAGLLQQLAGLETADVPGAQVTPALDAVLAGARQALLESLNDLGEQEGALIAPHQAGVTALLQQIRARNTAIPVVHAFEANQKSLIEIGIKMALEEPLSSVDFNSLENMAAQAEQEAGSTQWRAASLLSCLHQEVVGQEERAAEESLPPGQLHITPNPASDQVSVQFGGAFEGDVALYDAVGRACRRVALSGEMDVVLPLGDLAPGVYYIHVKGAGNAVLTEKLIINH